MSVQSISQELYYLAPFCDRREIHTASKVHESWLCSPLYWWYRLQYIHGLLIGAGIDNAGGDFNWKIENSRKIIASLMGINCIPLTWEGWILWGYLLIRSLLIDFVLLAICPFSEDVFTTQTVLKFEWTLSLIFYIQL